MKGIKLLIEIDNETKLETRICAMNLYDLLQIKERLEIIAMKENKDVCYEIIELNEKEF